MREIDDEVEVAEPLCAEKRVAGERAMLEMIARGQPLGETLDALARFIEAESEGALCSILLLDQRDSPSSDVYLRHGAGPSLPDAYNQAIDGMAIGPAAGSCGTAAYRGKPVFVSDIATDPLWDGYRELALPYGLRACWSTPIHGSDGRVLGTFALYHRRAIAPVPTEQELVDVLTYLASIAIERHRNEEERGHLLDREREARAAAEAAVQIRDEFLSIASHELRTPVTVVKGVAQMLQRAARRNRLDLDHLTNCVDTIQRASDRLSLLINDLLDVSRLQSGQLSVRPEQLDLGGLVRDIVGRHAEQVASGHVVQIGLPDSPAMVEADPIRIEQIVDNLLSNAVKYSPGASVIEVTVAKDVGGLTVSVRDSGIGLPEKAAERIFEPFGRGRNAVGLNLPGMGLGLYVSRRIAELHGGRLWAESSGEDQGTTVYFWLPDAGGASTSPEGESL